MREPLRFTGKIMSATISCITDRWFVSITVDMPSLSHLTKAENQGTVGVDLGVSALATLSTGEKVEGPKAHKAMLARLRRLSRGLSQAEGVAKRLSPAVNSYRSCGQLHAIVAQQTFQKL
jgi:putative transposase